MRRASRPGDSLVCGTVGSVAGSVDQGFAQARAAQLKGIVVDVHRLEERTMNSTPREGLAYEVFVSEAPAQPGALPNGEPRSFSPIASTLIFGEENLQGTVGFVAYRIGSFAVAAVLWFCVERIFLDLRDKMLSSK